MAVQVNRVKSTNDLELKDRLVAINRVTKVTKGGRAFSFAAIVVVGNEGIAVKEQHILIRNPIFGHIVVKILNHPHSVIFNNDNVRTVSFLQILPDNARCDLAVPSCRKHLKNRLLCRFLRFYR